MVRTLFVVLIGALAALAVACGGDDDAPGDTSGSPTIAPSGTVDPNQQALRDQLASILLQANEVPPGLDVGAPIFATNEQAAGTNQEALQHMIETGRQLGADKTFLPTDRLSPAESVRGGVQSSASVYTGAAGAAQTFQETVDEARANDWAANYPDLEELRVDEIPQTIGDESLWLRISGLEQCEAAVTNTPGPDGTVPPATCEGKKRVILDNIIFRVGRVRALISVSSLVAQQAEPDILVPQFKGWADLVAGRAATTFPSS